MNDPVSAKLSLPDPLIAIVGATDAQHKYGSIIYLNLKRKGYRVVGINPTRSTVDGDPCFRSLADLPENPDIVNIVVPPQRTLRVLEAAAAVPQSYLEATSLIGPESFVRDRIQTLRDSGVTNLQVGFLGNTVEERVKQCDMLRNIVEKS